MLCKFQPMRDLWEAVVVNSWLPWVGELTEGSCARNSAMGISSFHDCKCVLSALTPSMCAGSTLCVSERTIDVPEGYKHEPRKRNSK